MYVPWAGSLWRLVAEDNRCYPAGRPHMRNAGCDQTQTLPPANNWNGTRAKKTETKSLHLT